MSTAEFDFPPIEAPPAPVTPPTKLLSVVAPAADKPPSIKETVLAQFKTAEADIVALAEKYIKVAYDCTTTKGMAEAVAARRDLRENGRLFLTRTERDVKADVNDLKRVMADEVARLVAIVEPVEAAIDSQIQAELDRKAAAKAERDRIEADRVAKHQAGILKIIGYLALCQQSGMTADRIANGIAKLEAVAFGPEWQEYAVPAADAQCKMLDAMRALHEQAVEREAELARLEAQRVEQARQAAVLAVQRAELDRRAAELAALETAARQAREAQEQVEREAKEARAEAQRIADEQRAREQAKSEAQARFIEDQQHAAAEAAAAAIALVAATAHQPVADPASLAIDLFGDAVAPIEADTPCTYDDLAVSLAQCRAALFDACELLDGWIKTKAGNEDGLHLYRRVNELRDLGGLPHPISQTTSN